MLSPIIKLSAQSQCPDATAIKWKEKALQADNDLDGSAEAYRQAAMYEIAVCACKSGELSPDADVNNLRTKAMAAKTYSMRMKSGLTYRPWPSKCKFESSHTDGVDGSVSANGGLDERPLLMKGAVINQQLMGYLGDIAGSSNNHGFKSMVNDMQEVSNTVSETRNTLNTFGLNTAEHDDFLNLVENAGHAIAIGKALFGKPPSLEEQLSPSQLQARSVASDLLYKLEDIHQNASTINRLTSNDPKLLERIQLEKEKFAQYDFYTAPSRLLVIEWLRGNNFMSMQEYIAMEEKIGNMTYQQISNTIASHNGSSIKNNYGYLLTEDIAFKQENNRMNLILASHHEKNGDETKAKEVLERIDFDVKGEDAPALLYESYINQQYKAASLYYEALKAHLTKRNMVYLSDIEGITDYDPNSFYASYDDINRDRLLFTLNLGVLSMIYRGNTEGVEEEIKYLENFNDQVLQFKDWKKYKKNKLRTSETNQTVKLQHQIGEAIIHLSRALLESKIKSNSGSRDSFVSSSLDAVIGFDHTLDEDFIKVQTELVYLTILINQEKWDEAIKHSYVLLKESVSWNAEDRYTNNPMFSRESIKIEQAFIYYKKGDYKRAEGILKLLTLSKLDDERIEVLNMLIAAKEAEK